MSVSARAKRVEEEVKLDFKDVLIRPRLSLLKSRAEVDLRKRFKFLNSKAEYYGVPVMASNMDTVGTFEMAVALAKVDMFSVVQKHYSVEQWKAFAAANRDVLKNVAMSAGMTDDLNDLAEVLNAVPELAFICLDVANGYSTHFVDYVRRVRERFPRHTIMAGNVVTGEMVEILLQAGADIIKIGIGPGSVCTTRRKTGVGYPQLSAVLDCAEAAHRLGGHVISDGGCTCAGDVAKAFGAGSDFVMLGGMLAGHAESGGELVVKNGRQMKMFYGMSSQTAQHKYHGGLAEYRASEGKTVEIEYRGEVSKTVLDILGGLRSACTYVGAPTLADFGNCCTFIRCLTQTNDIFSPSPLVNNLI